MQQSAGGYDTRGTAPPRSEAFRMQATALGRYLLFGEDRDFLAIAGGGIAPATDPSSGAEWRVVPVAGGRYQLVSVSTGRPLARAADGAVVLGAEGQGDRATRFGFAASTGCANYPEIGLNATGTENCMVWPLLSETMDAVVSPSGTDRRRAEWSRR